MARNNIDIAVSVAIAAGTVAIAFLDPQATAVRLLYAIPLVLVLPGYILTAATFSDRLIGFFERLAWCVGLSLACAALTGVILDAASVALTARSWSLSLSAIVVCGAVPAWLRRRSFEGLPLFAERARLQQTYALLLAAILTTAAAGVAVAGVDLQPRPGFSALWLVPVDGAQQARLTIGIRNEEGEPTSYRVQVTIQGTTVAEWSDVRIEDGDAWTEEVVLPPVLVGGDAVTAALFREDEPGEVYRLVQVWRTPSTGNASDP